MQNVIALIVEKRFKLRTIKNERRPEIVFIVSEVDEMQVFWKEMFSYFTLDNRNVPKDYFEKAN